MGERPWYKRYGADFIHGTLGLSLEEKGAYSLCLDLIYDRGRPIPDDPRWLAGVCGVSVRKWKALRASLIAAGKIVEQDGCLSNVRAEKELENAAKTARKHAENGAKGGAKSAKTHDNRNKNNDLDQAGLKHRARYQKPEARSQSVSNDTPRARDLAHDIRDAVEIWNAMAAEAGLARCQKLTEARKSRLKARLADCGGVPGWRDACDRVRGSPFLRGENDRGWRADIDFLLAEAKFTKLMEGGYERGEGKSNWLNKAIGGLRDDLRRRQGAEGGEQDSRLLPAGQAARAGSVHRGAGGGAGGPAGGAGRDRGGTEARHCEPVLVSADSGRRDPAAGRAEASRAATAAPRVFPGAAVSAADRGRQGMGQGEGGGAESGFRIPVPGSRFGQA